VLESAIANAQYVLIGEDHITREIPQFTAAVCDMMAPQGLTAMALEVGPQVAEFVSSSLGKPDRLARMAALNRQYPDSVAFLNLRQENDLAAHCAQIAHTPHFHLWGLDQEFVGSAGWLLDQILATHPGAAATAALRDAFAQQPAFPKGAIIRAILRDYRPEELAGGATLFHEHMQLAPDFFARFAAATAAARAANGLPPAPARGGGGGGGKGGGTPAPPPPDIMHNVDLMSDEVAKTKSARAQVIGEAIRSRHSLKSIV
jgi:hypothetical protein